MAGRTGVPPLSPIDEKKNLETSTPLSSDQGLDPQDPHALQPTTQTSGTVSTPVATATDRYTHFKHIVGLEDKKQPTPFYKRVNNAYYFHSAQYWFVASLINFLLLMQIVFGALITAFATSDNRGVRRAIIWLGGTNTVVAAVLAYFKSRNQPNRVRQFRTGLGKVRDALADVEADFRSATDPGHAGDGLTPAQIKAGKEQAHADVEAKVQHLRQMYYDARNDAEANYPDLWVKYGDAVDKAMLKMQQQGQTVILPGAGNTALKPSTLPANIAAGNAGGGSEEAGDDSVGSSSGNMDRTTTTASQAANIGGGPVISDPVGIAGGGAASAHPNPNPMAS